MYPFSDPPSSTGTHGTITGSSFNLTLSGAPTGESTHHRQYRAGSHRVAKSTGRFAAPGGVLSNLPNTSVLFRSGEFNEWKKHRSDADTEDKENVSPTPRQSVTNSPARQPLRQKTRSPQLRATVQDDTGSASSMSSLPVISSPRSRDVEEFLDSLEKDDLPAPRTRSEGEAGTKRTAKPAFAIPSHMPSTLHQHTKSFVLPDCTYLNDLIAGNLDVGLTRSGLPVLVKHEKAVYDPRAEGSSHAAIHDVGIAQDERDIYVTMNQIREEVAILAEHDHFVQEEAEDLRLRFARLQAQMARAVSNDNSNARPDASLLAANQGLRAMITEIETRLQAELQHKEELQKRNAEMRSDTEDLRKQSEGLRKDNEELQKRIDKMRSDADDVRKAQDERLKYYEGYLKQAKSEVCEAKTRERDAKVREREAKTREREAVRVLQARIEAIEAVRDGYMSEVSMAHNKIKGLHEAANIILRDELEEQKQFGEKDLLAQARHNEMRRLKADNEALHIVAQQTYAASRYADQHPMGLSSRPPKDKEDKEDTADPAASASDGQASSSKKKLRVERPIPVSDRDLPGDDHTMRPTRPPADALDIVLAELRLEIQRIGYETRATSQRLRDHDNAVDARGRTQLEDELKHLCNTRKHKCQQLYRLFDVMEGQKQAGQRPMTNEELEVTLASVFEPEYDETCSNVP